MQARLSLLVCSPLPRLPGLCAASLPLPEASHLIKMQCAVVLMTHPQGVALDDLVYIMTRMARQMEAEGVSRRRRRVTLRRPALPLEQPRARLTTTPPPWLSMWGNGTSSAWQMYSSCCW